MGKKRKATAAQSSGKSTGPREYNPKDGKLGPISTYRDVMNEQDQFEHDDDEILFDGGRKSKRQKAEELLSDDDEEILGYSDDSDDDDDDDEPHKQPRKPAKSGKRQDDNDSDSGKRNADEEENDEGYWGASRKDYYDADQIETTVDAEEEEKEALRLQKKKLAKMSEADFFNENEWLAGEPEDADQDDVVTEVLKEVEIPADMGTEERNRLLQSRYPELPLLADELLQLQPRLVELQKEAESQESDSLVVVKYRVLGSLVATIAMYFGILTSPARDGDGVAKTLDPSELREHEVMSTLLECREAWKKVEHLETPKPVQPADSLPSPPEGKDEDKDADMLHEDAAASKRPKETNKDKRAKAKAERKAKAIEDSLADLDSLLTSKKASKKKSASKETVDDSNSDFGEEDYLDGKAAADKAARKKSLRFYTSQIAQKANRRAAGGRDAGGDMDIPYRERLKDRQARLNAEAEKRGKKGANIGADLGEASDDEDHEAAKAIRDEGDKEYYDMIASASHQRKGDKAAKAAAIAAAGSADRVVKVAKVGADGRRQITYAIKANKGLAPKRKKEVRNPRGMCAPFVFMLSYFSYIPK
ncbi:Sas10 C-terminal domain-containing protein [Xylaria sp. CBS 124048]|nr:Sas10 C-terminal domain-containing protein [Xylaria sp. CBS 124048]